MSSETQQSSTLDVSLVIPMYDEADNIPDIAARFAEAFDEKPFTFELILVNDGSLDETEKVAREASARDARVRLVSYQPNRGRGYALRAGMREARGGIVVTTEADLSYSSECLLQMIAKLQAEPMTDMVVASPYMPGGKVENVPPFRAWISRTGNRVLGMAMSGRVSTMTGMTRAYRRHVLQSLELESDGKEIHIEILSKAFALGFRVAEVPATLSSRKKGKSKFKLGNTARSHLVFSLFEQPMLLFGLVGLILGLLGFLGGVYLAILRYTGNLTPGRPLFFLVLLLILGGIQFLSFGFIGTQIVALRKEVYKIQKQCKHLLISGRDEESGPEDV